jgi:hypothetical protein
MTSPGDTLLLLSPRRTPESAAVGFAAREAGWVVFRSSAWEPRWHLSGSDAVALYGEPIFASSVSAQLPLALLDVPPCWLAELPFPYRLRRVEAMTADEARSRSGPIFVKSTVPGYFASTVYPTGAALPPPSFLPAESPVQTCEPVAWEVEARCFVLNREVTTVSVYMRHGEWNMRANGRFGASVGEIAEALAFAERFVSDPGVVLPPAVVVDVGRIAGRGWAVVEANPAWASAVYGCDPARVLPVVRRACVRRDQLAEEDLSWT